MIELILGKNKFPFTFNIDHYLNNIGLMFSGGVESTLLLYLLTNEIKNSPRLLTTYVVDRPNKPLDHAYQIFNNVCNLTKFSGRLTTLDIPAVVYYRQLPIATTLVQKSHDEILWGINKYPIDSSIRPNQLFNFREDNKLRLPFKNLEKYHTIDAYYKLGIEHLLPLTHSCGIGNTIPCGACFNCRERKWAYNMLDIEPNLGC